MFVSKRIIKRKKKCFIMKILLSFFTSFNITSEDSFKNYYLFLILDQEFFFLSKI